MSGDIYIQREMPDYVAIFPGEFLSPLNVDFEARFSRMSRLKGQNVRYEDSRFNMAGVTIFRGIHAVDGDKPNTPNSDVYYAIVKGNEQGKFSLESGHRTALILRKPVDYDSGDREFTLVITATVSRPRRLEKTRRRCDVVNEQ